MSRDREFGKVLCRVLLAEQMMKGVEIVLWNIRLFRRFIIWLAWHFGTRSVGYRGDEVVERRDFLDHRYIFEVGGIMR